MYALYKVSKDGTKWLVGYFDDYCMAAGAIEDDRGKHDDDSIYEMVREDDKDECQPE
jgi:hypothetical protein